MKPSPKKKPFPAPGRRGRHLGNKPCCSLLWDTWKGFLLLKDSQRKDVLPPIPATPLPLVRPQPSDCQGLSLPTEGDNTNRKADLLAVLESPLIPC